jgi:hypothetical protein
VLPLRSLMTPTGSGRDELRLEIGSTAAPLLQAQLQRDVSGASSRCCAARSALQDRLPALPATGVLLQAARRSWTWTPGSSAWQRWGRTATPGGGRRAGRPQPGRPAAQPDPASTGAQVGGRALGRVQAQIARDGSTGA